jgi:hypothetical protein
MPTTPIVNRTWSERTFSPGQSAQEVYEVSGVASDNDAIAAVGTAAGSTHLQDARLKVPLSGGISVSNVSPIMYKVRVSYATDAVTLGNNPLDEPADILPQFSRTTEPIDREYQGNPITNSARLPFVGVTDDSTSILITIAQYESTFDAQKILAYGYPHPTLNEDVVDIPRLGTFQPHQLKFLNAQLDVAFRPTTPYVRMVYQLEARGYRYFAPKSKGGASDYISGFAKRMLDQGRQGTYGDGDGNIKIGPIVFGEQDVNGNWEAVSDDVLLDGYGGVLDYPKHYVKSGDDDQTTFGDPPPVPSSKKPMMASSSTTSSTSRCHSLGSVSSSVDATRSTVFD